MTGLYKAKSKKTGEWVEGFYAQLPKTSLGATIISGGDLCAEDVSDYIIQNFSKQHSNFSNSFPLEVVECEIYEIDPETLCRPIGIKDKNGREIWENDIVKCNKRKDGFELYKVVWRHQYADFGVEPLSYEVRYPFCLGENGQEIKGRNYEVCGNIFDNPDLMERTVE